MAEPTKPRRPAMLSASRAEAIIGDEDPAESAAVAHVWARSPAFTLPGALWRAYLLSEWYHRDPGAVARRYEAGAASPRIDGLEAPVDVRPLPFVIEEVDSLLRGDLTDDDLDFVFAQAARACRVLAAADATWIDDPDDPLAHAVTTRSRALVRTADELDAAAREAASGALD